MKFGWCFIVVCAAVTIQTDVDDGQIEISTTSVDLLYETLNHEGQIYYKGLKIERGSELSDYGIKNTDILHHSKGESCHRHNQECNSIIYRKCHCPLGQMLWP